MTLAGIQADVRTTYATTSRVELLGHGDSASRVDPESAWKSCANGGDDRRALAGAQQRDPLAELDVDLRLVADEAAQLLA